MPFSRVTTNIGGAKPRYEMLDGARHLVVPMVMLTEGVHDGSDGPLLYEGPELSKRPVIWNHKPIVIGHPTLNGQGISACDPRVVEERRVGMVFNSDWDGRLKGEAWLREDKLAKVDNRVLDRLNRGEMVEISTGLFQDPIMQAGTWNKEHYIGKVSNIAADHLAILPDGKGACSIADGAGLLRNDNDLSFSEIKQQLYKLLKPASATPQPFANLGMTSDDTWVYITDLFVKFVIYEVGDSMYKQGYKVKSGTVSLDGPAEPVRRQTTYVTANGESFRSETQIVLPGPTVPGNLPGTTQENAPMPQPVSSPQPTSNVIHQGAGPLAQAALANTPAAAPPNPTPERVAQVNKLIGEHGWKEDDRALLSGMSDDQFARVLSISTKPVPTTPTTPPPANPPVAAATTPPTPAAATPPNAVAAALQGMSTDQVLSILPAPIANQMRQAIALNEQQKLSLVNTIMLNPRNSFTREFLMLKETPELQGIVALLGGGQQPTANMSGASQVPMFLTNSAPGGGQVTTPAGHVLSVPSILVPQQNGATKK